MYQPKHKKQLKREITMIGPPESISFQAAFLFLQKEEEKDV